MNKSHSPTDQISPIAEMPSTEDRIRTIAYQIWEDEGRPHGKSEEHWARACVTIAADDEAAVKPNWLQREGQLATPPIAEKSELNTTIDQIKKRMDNRAAA